MQKQTEKEMHAGMKKLILHHSHDSAIDADSQEWETETVAIETEQVSADASPTIQTFGVKTRDHFHRVASGRGAIRVKHLAQGHKVSGSGFEPTSR